MLQIERSLHVNDDVSIIFFRFLKIIYLGGKV